MKNKTDNVQLSTASVYALIHDAEQKLVTEENSIRMDLKPNTTIIGHLQATQGFYINDRIDPRFKCRQSNDDFNTCAVKNMPCNILEKACPLLKRPTPKLDFEKLGCYRAPCSQNSFGLVTTSDKPLDSAGTSNPTLRKVTTMAETILDACAKLSVQINQDQKFFTMKSVEKACTLIKEHNSCYESYGLQLGFKEMSVFRETEVKTDTLLRLGLDIAACLAFWLGASVISFTELLIHFINVAKKASKMFFKSQDDD